jgi:hypothetical protein
LRALRKRTGIVANRGLRSDVLKEAEKRGGQGLMHLDIAARFSGSRFEVGA